MQLPADGWVPVRRPYLALALAALASTAGAEEEVSFFELGSMASATAMEGIGIYGGEVRIGAGRFDDSISFGATLALGGGQTANGLNLGYVRVGLVMQVRLWRFRIGGGCYSQQWFMQRVAGPTDYMELTAGPTVDLAFDVARTRHIWMSVEAHGEVNADKLLFGTREYQVGLGVFVRVM